MRFLVEVTQECDCGDRRKVMMDLLTRELLVSPHAVAHHHTGEAREPYTTIDDWDYKDERGELASHNDHAPAPPARRDTTIDHK